MRSGWLIAVVATMALGSVAHADTITETLTTSAIINLYTRAEGYYIAYPDGVTGINGSTFQFGYPLLYGGATVPFEKLSVTVPDESVVTSVYLQVYAPPGLLTGTGSYESYPGVFGYSGSDPSEPS